MRRRGTGARFVREGKEGGFGVLDRKYDGRGCGTRRKDRKGEGTESSKITKHEASRKVLLNDDQLRDSRRKWKVQPHVW